METVLNRLEDNFCKSERHHTSCHAVNRFIVLSIRLGSAAEVAQPMALGYRDLAPPPPTQPEAVDHCSLVSWEKKVEASDPQHHQKVSFSSVYPSSSSF